MEQGVQKSRCMGSSRGKVCSSDNRTKLYNVLRIRTDLGKCIDQYDEKQGNKNPQALSTNCLHRVQADRQTTKEEENKEEDKQEEADARNVKNQMLGFLTFLASAPSCLSSSLLLLLWSIYHLVSFISTCSIISQTFLNVIP